MDRSTCSILGCPNPRSARGWCTIHYGNWRRHGDPLKSLKRNRRPSGVPFEEWFWQQLQVDGECFVWPWKVNHAGYGVIKAPWRTSPMKTHQVAWVLTNGEVPEGLEVLHRCDNPPCGKIEHLWLGTQADNMADAARKSRLGKLTGAQILEIRRLRGEGRAIKDLAREYEVVPTTIRSITLGMTWKHLLPPLDDTELDST